MLLLGRQAQGTSQIATALSEQAAELGNAVEVNIIKASAVIQEWADHKGLGISTDNLLLRAELLQDAGDRMRSEDVTKVALGLVKKIRKLRDTSEENRQRTSQPGKQPFRVYILDSLKHPAEVELLRRVYREAFCLVGVVCETEKRRQRLTDAKGKKSTTEDVERFIERDEDAGVKHGQKVAEAFHLADFFADNTADRLENGKENQNWDVNEQLGRLLNILTHATLCRPTPAETGMFHAYSAQLRSACLSRQVGAALMDSQGNLLSTGTNEVPRAGGGVYGGAFSDSEYDDSGDYRCAKYKKFCRNTRTAHEIVKELIEAIPQLNGADPSKLYSQVKKTSVGGLLEFSRAVHAEMDALLSAARQGASPVGGRLFTTTFPCHYCARHIVSAGVDEVQYIEPYPKSRALELHGDAITDKSKDWVPPSSDTNNPKKSTVLFRPFTGVAPRMYQRAFFKDRKLKDGEGTMSVQEPEWISGLLKESYQDIEKVLLGIGANDEQAYGDDS